MHAQINIHVKRESVGTEAYGVHEVPGQRPQLEVEKEEHSTILIKAFPHWQQSYSQRSSDTNGTRNTRPRTPERVSKEVPKPALSRQPRANWISPKSAGYRTGLVKCLIPSTFKLVYAEVIPSASMISTTRRNSGKLSSNLHLH